MCNEFVVVDVGVVVEVLEYLEFEDGGKVIC